MRELSLAMLVLLAACGPWPDLPAPEGAQDSTLEQPDFVPFETLRTPATDQVADTTEEEDALQARVAALKARASGLRQAQVD